MRPGIARTVGVSLALNGEPVAGDVDLAAPKGWKAEPASSLFGQTRFALRAARVEDRNIVKVSARAGGKRATARFVILGPGEAKGWPSVANVPRCRNCGAWENACVCKK